jgi:hypothetical protein
VSEQSKNQIYHLILADIAMVAAIDANGSQVIPADREDYAPGSIRDHWMARMPDSLWRRRVFAMSNAGIASLQNLPVDRLIATAERLGVPFTDETAKGIADYFAMKREALLLYNR